MKNLMLRKRCIPLPKLYFLFDVIINAPKKVYLATTSVTLDGSGSNDLDGKIVKFYWTRISGPSGYTYRGAQSAVLTVDNLGLCKYIYQLFAVDNSGDTGSAKVTFQVVGDTGENTLPTVAISVPARVYLPASEVGLDGSRSFDEDGNIVKYEWSRISGPGGYQYQNYRTSILTIKNLRTGKYRYALKVTDNRGGTASATCSFLVRPDTSGRNTRVVENNNLKSASWQSSVNTSRRFNVISGWQSTGLRIAPNPSGDYIILSLNGQPMGKANVLIFDARGKLVANYDAGEKAVSSWQYKLNIGYLNADIYYCKLTIGSYCYSEKFMTVGGR